MSSLVLCVLTNNKIIIKIDYMEYERINMVYNCQIYRAVRIILRL